MRATQISAKLVSDDVDLDSEMVRLVGVEKALEISRDQERLLRAKANRCESEMKGLRKQAADALEDVARIECKMREAGDRAGGLEHRIKEVTAQREAAISDAAILVKATASLEPRLRAVAGIVDEMSKAKTPPPPPQDATDEDAQAYVQALIAGSTALRGHVQAIVGILAPEK